MQPFQPPPFYRVAGDCLVLPGDGGADKEHPLVFPLLHCPALGVAPAVRISLVAELRRWGARNRCGANGWG